MPDLNALLNPRSIALIGASPEETTIRGRMVQGVKHLPYPGEVVAVSRTHKNIGGLRTVSSVEDLPYGMDLAVIAVPSQFVASALRTAAERGVRASVIISSGFAEERGEAGKERQDEVVAIIKQYDLAVCGPNAEGFLNATAPVAATFSPTALELEHGSILHATPGGAMAVVSQSGGIGFSFLNRGVPAGIPVSYVISTGNEAGVDSLTLTEHLLDDEATGVVLIFLEGLKRPDKLDAVAAKAATLGKYIIVAKMGRSSAGAAAAESHTASLAGSYRAYEAKLRRCGVLMATDQDHALALARTLTYWGARRPKGKRVGILTPSGGAGIWLADICSDYGLELPELDAQTRADFDEVLPAYGVSRNPVDITAQFVAQYGYARAVEIMARSTAVDCIIVVASLIHPGAMKRDQDNLKAIVATLDIPTLVCTYTRTHNEAVEVLSSAGLPCFTSMVDAARAVADLALDGEAENYHESVVEETLPSPTPPPAATGPLLSEFQTRHWLALGGVPMPEVFLAADADQAFKISTDVGAPVALKVQIAAIAHKTEAGLVALDVRPGEDVQRVFEKLLAAASEHTDVGAVEGVQLQAMSPEGVEIIVGVQQDPDFGPMLLLGSGGILVELINDTRMVALPIDEQGIRAELRALKCWPLLRGFRGRPAADVDALVALMLSLQTFALANGEHYEDLELNPIRVHATGMGVTILDASARLRDKPLPTEP
jgi:acetate---CoA ligase (ADP-forming)